MCCLRHPLQTIPRTIPAASVAAAVAVHVWHNDLIYLMNYEQWLSHIYARKERVVLIGTDQRITSGPAARTAALRGRIHDCTRIVSRTGQILFPCTAGAVHT
jgi:hypothetical protein